MAHAHEESNGANTLYSLILTNPSDQKQPFQQSENFISAGHLGKARLYSDIHTASRCSTGASNRHFIAPCVPMGSVIRPRRPRFVYTSTGLNGTRGESEEEIACAAGGEEAAHCAWCTQACIRHEEGVSQGVRERGYTRAELRPSMSRAAFIPGTGSL